FGRAVAGELARALALGNVEPDFTFGRRARAFPRRAGRGLLLGHRRVEPGLVDRDAADSQSVLGQVVGAAVGIVELERGATRQAVALPQLYRRFVEQAQALVERLAQARLLALKRFLDQ